MSSTTKRTDDEAIILALLSSRTQAEAARKLGINSNLISERKQDKEFTAKYDAYKSTLIENTANKLLTSNTQAIDTLVDLLDDNNSSVRVSSAKTILSYAKEYIMLADLDKRLQVIEDAMKQD